MVFMYSCIGVCFQNCRNPRQFSMDSTERIELNKFFDKVSVLFFCFSVQFLMFSSCVIEPEYVDCGKMSSWQSSQ